MGKALDEIMKHTKAFCLLFFTIVMSLAIAYRIYTQKVNDVQFLQLKVKFSELQKEHEKLLAEKPKEVIVYKDKTKEVIVYKDKPATAPTTGSLKELLLDSNSFKEYAEKYQRQPMSARKENERENLRRFRHDSE